MLIEIIGQSGSGKTTLMNSIISELRQKNKKAYPAVEHVYKIKHLHVIESCKLRNILLTFLLLPDFIRALSVNMIRMFVLFSLITIFENPTLDTINRIRNFIIRVASYCLLKDEKELFLMDEGIVNTAHNVLVYPHVYPSAEKIRRFLDLVPKPDYVIYVSVDYNTSIKRTLARPDPPLKKASVTRLKYFVRNGYLLFKQFAESPQLSDRCIMVPGEDLRLATELSVSLIMCNLSSRD